MPGLSHLGNVQVCLASPYAGRSLGKVVVVMETIEGTPYWFGLSMPRQNGSMLGNQWWCTIVLLVLVYHHHGGLRSVWWCVSYAVNPRYVYVGDHSLQMTHEHSISAPTLIIALREEETRRSALSGGVATMRALESVTRYLTPLDDRPWTWAEGSHA